MTVLDLFADDEADFFRLRDVLVAKVGRHGAARSSLPPGPAGDQQYLELIVGTVIADTWLVTTGTMKIEDYQPREDEFVFSDELRDWVNETAQKIYEMFPVPTTMTHAKLASVLRGRVTALPQPAATPAHPTGPCFQCGRPTIKDHERSLCDWCRGER